MSIQIKTVVCGEIQENAYVVSVEGREDCILVDPGDDYLKLKRALGGRQLAAILLTHGHFDHILAAGRLAADCCAPVYAAAEDMEMLNDPAINGLESLMGENAMVEPPIRAQAFDKTLSVAGMDFQIIATPGHSKGSVCLYLSDEGALFSGDTLFEAGFGRMDLYGGSPMEMRVSLKKLFGMPGEIKVYPGHGSSTTIGDERSRYRL